MKFPCEHMENNIMCCKPAHYYIYSNKKEILEKYGRYICAKHLELLLDEHPKVKYSLISSTF